MDAGVLTAIVTTAGSIAIAGVGLFSTRRWGQAQERAEEAETANERLTRERTELAAERVALALRVNQHVDNLEEENARLRALLAKREGEH